MAFPTTLTIKLGTEAQAEAAAKDLCAAAGVEFSAPNAHQVAVEVLKGYIEGYRHRQAPITEAPLT